MSIPADGRARVLAAGAVLAFGVAGLAAGAVGTAAADARQTAYRARVHRPLIVFWDSVISPGHENVRNEIFTVGPHGGHRRRLTFRGESEGPRWGPFGHRIVYTHRTARGGSQIWVMNRHGGGKRRLSSSGQHSDWAPDFAPNARRVVFVRWDGRPGGDTDLAIYTFSSHRTTRLHVGSGFRLIAGAPSWSPDGRTIAFTGANKLATSDEPQRDLFTVHPDGTGLTQITHTPHWAEDAPSWSPHGSRLVYSRVGGARAGVFCEELDTIDPNGGSRARVPVGCDALGATWTPGGRRLLADLGRPRHRGLWSTALDGHHQRFIVSGTGGEWRPRGPRLHFRPGR